MGNEIELQRLRKAINMIFDHMVGDLKLSSVEIDPERDYYWDVASGSRHDVACEIPVLDIGRLSDDLEFLGVMTATDDAQQAPALMLIHVAPLLRFIGEKVGQ